LRSENIQRMTEREDLTAAVLQSARSEKQCGELSCVDAFALARKHGVAVGRIGEICNANGIRIAQCQLGCF